MERSDVVGTQSEGARRPRLRWVGLAALLSLAVVAWEYLLNAAMNPVDDWNLTGVAAHMGLDVAMVLPVVALSLWAGLRAARRWRMETSEWAGVLGIAGLVAVVFLAAMVPVVGTRDLAHEWMGNTYGLSLAEVQITQVRTDLTVQLPKQLCSFASLRNPSLAGNPDGLDIPVLFRIESIARALLLQLAVLLPLLLLGLFARFRAELPRADFRQPVAFLRWWARPLRLGTLGVLAVLGFCYGNGVQESYAQSVASSGSAPYNACEDGGPRKVYNVTAIDVEITMNRYGDFTPTAFMYALNDNIPTIRAFEQELKDTRAAMVAAADVNAPGLTRVTPGLRKDPIQPLVIRANLGDCVEINFTNDLQDGKPASMHLLGLSHTVENAGSAVGENAPSYAEQGDTITYEIPIPLDPMAERAYYFHDHGSGTLTLPITTPPGTRVQFRARQGLGLFGALVVEPEGSTYLDVETGQPLTTATGNNWEAIIIDEDGKSFREFVIMYHEFGHENYRPILDFQGNILPLLDGPTLSGVYRPAARAINYRSEPFRRRIELSNLVNGDVDGSFRNGKSLGYASYPFGDPATPIPRSYLGEATKTRLLHGGAEIFHVHHLHGGGDRWRRNPQADPNNNFWKGLTKAPQQEITSVHLDSQSVGPGSSYNLEHECGAGGCQQGEGEFLYHCHIGHHYIAGMWAFWRVFATVQTAEIDIHGHPLFVEPRLFQADNPFTDEQAPSNTPPVAGVSAGALIGLEVDWGREIVADASFSNPFTQVKLSDWIKNQLPPQGVRWDNNDATVWDWVTTGSDATLKVLGEPEETRPIANWESSTPGQRPEVLFNPKNGRYTWPLFRPHAAARPPFTARHTGSPWLGEEMIPGRMDGLCANNFVHPSVFLGLGAVKRYYPVSAITMPIPVSPDRSNPNGMIYVLNEDEQAIRGGQKPAEPLAIRSNVGDCVEIIFTNNIPDGPLNRQFSKVNIHSHFVQFDTQASDGVIAGFSYEQAVRPYQTEGRTLTQAANQFTTTLKVTNTARLRPGIWIGIGLGKGTCVTNPLTGQPLPCTEIRKIAAIPAPDTITLDLPLLLNHGAGEHVGVEFVRYNWYSDVDFGTVFFHTHVETKDWDHGLFGAHIVEPKGSTYHDPVTGNQVRAGTLVDVHSGFSLLKEPVADGVNGSFREFMLFLHDMNPTEGQGAVGTNGLPAFRHQDGGGTINLRAAPWRLRGFGNPAEDPAHRFSSVRWGDPHTQEVRAYVGDPVVIRGMGLIERVGGIRVTGHRFNIERYTNKSDLRDTTFIGISERYDFALEGGAGGPKGYPGDYLYYSTLARDFEAGGWGLLRVYDSLRGDLKKLPDRPNPTGTSGFPQLAAGAGTAPPSLNDGPGTPCPVGAPVRTYSLNISDTSIIYSDAIPAGEPGVSYFLDGDPTTNTRTPMVVRVNKGECLRVNLRNSRTNKRSGFSVGELPFDPQRSYGTAVGLNHDSSVAPGAVRTYEYYADKELGLTLALNLGDVDSLPLGAWGGVVVEPQGSTYRAPGTLDPLPGGGTGVQADIVKDGLATREFVALFMDGEDRLGANQMPYPEEPERTASHSYTKEPLNLRDFANNPADVFRSDLWNDPRHVVTVPAGAKLVYRVGQPWGEQPHLATLEGHRYLQEPGMQGSEAIYNDILVPGMTLNLDFIGGAGGDLQAPGDYLFLDRTQPYLQHGLWHILRVTDAVSGALSAPDSVTVTNVATEGGRTTVSGVVGTKPAGDTVGHLTVFDGARANGACTGKRLGTVRVDRGSGRWEFGLQSDRAPSQFCIQSSGGGTASGTVADLVTPRTKKVQEFQRQKEQEKQLLLDFQEQFKNLEEELEAEE